MPTNNNQIADAINKSQLPRKIKSVLSALLSFRNHQTERCNPGHNAVAARMGGHQNTVRRCVRDAELVGVLTIIRSTGGYSKATQATNHYAFNLEAIKSYERGTKMVGVPNCDPYQIEPTPLPKKCDTPTKMSSKPSIEHSLEPKDREPLPPVPESLNSGRFPAQWAAFVQHRREIKKPMTPRAASIILRKCEEWGVVDSCKAVDNAIAAGWRDLFKPKPEYQNGRPPPQIGPVVIPGGYVPMKQRAEF